VQQGVKIVAMGVEIGIHAFPTPTGIIDIKISCAFAAGEAPSRPCASIVHGSYSASGESEYKSLLATTRIDRYV